MTIRTTCELYDSNSNKILKGNTEHSIPEQNFDTHAFHCDTGSVVILTEYSQREIKTFGGLDAKEVSEKGDNGLPIILIEERMSDCISRQAAIDEIKKMHFPSNNRELDDLHYGQNTGYDVAIEILQDMPSVTPTEDYKKFAEWVASFIFEEDWDFNKNAFDELACRKLNKLGIVNINDNNEWEYEAGENNDR